jgi:hypothetical protein
MKDIDTSALTAQGYSEAPEWDGGFGKPFHWPNLLLAVAFFGALAALVVGKIAIRTGGLIMLASFIGLLLLWIFFRHSSPVSPVTGKKLAKYLNRHPKHGDAIAEVVYVDHEAKRFFCHVFLKNDSTPSG